MQLVEVDSTLLEDNSDAVAGRGCSCWTEIRGDIVTGRRLEGTLIGRDVVAGRGMEGTSIGSDVVNVVVVDC